MSDLSQLLELNERVNPPDFDDIIAVRRRRSRRAHAAVACGITAAGVVAVVGALTLGGGSNKSEPAPSPSPSIVDTRPLVYAAGATVHVGDDSFDAGGNVDFLDATDDGVVFVTEDSDQFWYSDTLWFNDGSTTEAIGRVPTEHVAMFAVWTANPGTLVVWPDATSSTNDPRVQLGPYQVVAYDTSRHEVVARLPFGTEVLHVDDSQIFFAPDEDTPGCWVNGIHSCKDPHLMRYDLASGTTQRIAEAAFHAELRTRDRMLVLGGWTGPSARFDQVGRTLVVEDDSEGVLRRTTGETVALRVPSGYIAARLDPRDGGGPIPLVQWLDDDRVVLFPNEGSHDSLHEVGDLLECRLSDGMCRVAVRASSTLYVAPGRWW